MNNEVSGCSGEIKILRIAFELEGENLEIFPVLLDDASGSGERILVDCGYPGFLPLLECASEKCGVSLDSLTAVLVTHQDHDHAGALAEIKERYPNVAVMTSEEDAPCIAGERKLLRLAMVEMAWDVLTEREKEEARIMEADLSAMRPVPVDRTLRDGDVFPWCGGTEVVATPGHMPGHISLYLRAHKTLIAGDALVALNGRLRIAYPRYAIDLAEARRSAKKLEKLGAERVICYHGGLVEGGIKGRLRG